MGGTIFEYLDELIEVEYNPYDILYWQIEAKIYFIASQFEFKKKSPDTRKYSSKFMPKGITITFIPLKESFLEERSFYSFEGPFILGRLGDQDSVKTPGSVQFDSKVVSRKHALISIDDYLKVSLILLFHVVTESKPRYMFFFFFFLR